MSAPPKNKHVATCENKNRYADEFAARVAGMESLDKRPETRALWVYRCKVCRGWHLTSRSQGRARMVTQGSPVYTETS